MSRIGMVPGNLGDINDYSLVGTIFTLSFDSVE